MLFNASATKRKTIKLINTTLNKQIKEKLTCHHMLTHCVIMSGYFSITTHVLNNELFRKDLVSVPNKYNIKVNTVKVFLFANLFYLFCRLHRLSIYVEN